MIREHYRRRDDNRAGELDPATFDYPEDWQIEAEAKAVFWLLRGGLAFVALCFAAGLWALGFFVGWW